jgi:hypothetical protein
MTRRVTSGNPIRIPAADWNLAVAAGRAHAESALGGGRGVGGVGSRPPWLVTVRNDSGADRAQYDVLALTGHAFSPGDNEAAFRAEPCWTGTKPVTADVGKWALLLEPVAAGAVTDRAAVQNTWVTKIYVEHEKQQWADVRHNDGRLWSNWYGAARILWKESGLESRWAVVRLGESFWGPVDGRANAEIPAGGSGVVEVYAGGDYTNNFVTAWLNWNHGNKPLKINKTCSMTWKPAESKLVITGGDC